jgi:short subunit dehydrogenase-like uncharacterized protein
VVQGPDAYDATAAFIAEAGIALAIQRDVIPGQTVFNGGGFLTPATAFGSILIDRLNKAGVSFAVSD